MRERHKELIIIIPPPPTWQSANTQLTPSHLYGLICGSCELAKCVILGTQQDKLSLADIIVDDFGNFKTDYPDPLADFQIPASPVRHSFC